jgi:hypothetical protein
MQATLASARRSGMVRVICKPASTIGVLARGAIWGQLGWWGASEKIRRPMEPAGPGGRHNGGTRPCGVRAQGRARPASERRAHRAAVVRVATFAGRGNHQRFHAAGRRSRAHSECSARCRECIAAAEENFLSRFPACQVISVGWAKLPGTAIDCARPVPGNFAHAVTLRSRTAWATRR